jgi:hypothetical protein
VVLGLVKGLRGMVSQSGPRRRWGGRSITGVGEEADLGDVGACLRVPVGGGGLEGSMVMT